MSWTAKDKVVVPLDFSDESFRAIDTALDFVAGSEHVHVVHVLPDLSAIEPAELWEAVDHTAMSNRARKAIRERLPGPRYQDLQIAILFGDPGQAVVDYARQEHADLIVMPSHGRSGLKRLLLGSVAERVIRLADCPVLVLRPDDL